VLLGTRRCDQTVRVFDIRSIKEWVVLRGHKKGICCTSYLTLQLPRPNALLTLSSNCPGTAHCASHSRLLWLPVWRRNPLLPPLGSLLSDRRPPLHQFSQLLHHRPPRRRHFASIALRAARARDTSTSTADPLSAYIPPARPPARLHVKRLHDPILGARATRQRCLCLCPGRPLSPRLCDLTTAGTARQWTTTMHSQCPASAAQSPSRTPVGVV
jgi:hypothetical protein